MTDLLDATPRHRPVLDPGLVPAALWTRAYAARVRAARGSLDLGVALRRPDGTTFVHRTRILPPSPANAALNRRHVERLAKFLLWQKGGSDFELSGPGAAAAARILAAAYAPRGPRAFDREWLCRRMFGRATRVRVVRRSPDPRETTRPLGRHLDGCRIGFDLGGSDRKCAAVIDGRVVFSDEVKWDPYFQKDPWYHLAGIQDTLRRAAAHLPRVDAIGGSAAGVYVNNEPRAASLFRGISEADFDRHVRGMFRALQAWWGGVPFEVANDGEVTALAGSMSLKANAVLGLSLGTSTAGGYVTPDGRITPWLNELAFVPLDYRDDAPVDEWSGDVGCGVQHFSQQAVARLLPAAGIRLPARMPLPEKLIEVQRLMARGDARARRIYETIGAYLGFGVAQFADFYTIEHVLVLGRVLSGEGGDVILRAAAGVLKEEFPELAERIRLRTPSEKDRRHGQAVAAASLPEIRRPGINTKTPGTPRYTKATI